MALEAFWRSGWFGRETPGEAKIFRYGRLVAQGAITESQELADHGIVGTLEAPRQTPGRPVSGSMVPCGLKGVLHRYRLASAASEPSAEILQLTDYFLTAGER